MTIMPVAEWMPDMPELSNATAVALNVIPRTPESYGPMASLAAYSDELNGPCIGAEAMQNIDLSVNIFAGTASKLYLMDDGSNPEWEDVSGTAYSTAQGDSWRFDTFGAMALATNFANPIQVYTMGVSTAFADLSADAPQARHICTPKSFVMVGNTYDSVGGLGPSRVWWCANGDPTSWPDPGSALAQQTMSDFQDFPGTFGAIYGLVDSLASADVAIFFRSAVWRGIYVGPPDVFDFFPTENVRGCPCPNGIVALGAIVYYPGEDGFYAFDGSQSIPLGANKFDRWFWGLVNQAYLYNVVGAADLQNKLIIWIFPTTASSSGVPDMALMYRWDIQRASYAQISMEWILRLLTFGVTLDTFSALGFTNLDTIPASLDSSVWVGGAAQFGAIDTAHKLAHFTGPNLAAQVGMQTVQPVPNKRAWLSSVRPLVELTTGAPTIAVAGRTNLYDPIVYGDAVPPNAAGECPQRVDARYFDGIVAMPAASAWTHISGIDVTEVRPAGSR